MLRNKKGKTKIIGLIIGIAFILIIGYIVVCMTRLRNLSIGKIVDIHIQDGSADYLEMLLEPENEKDYSNKLILLDRDAVEQLIQYMRDNDVRIVSGTYQIPQTSDYKEMISILEFEPEIEASGIQEDMLAYWMVLNNKKPFISANEGCQEFFWEEYFWCTSEPDPLYTVYDFGIVDLDHDGSRELVMTGFPETTQVLDYQEGKVYSYQFVYRGMARITVDGIYSSGSAADIGGFHRISLDKGSYEEETLAYMEHDHYEVEGIEVSSREFYAYTEPIANAEQMETMDFTEEMLCKILLGGPTEEELSILESMEPEEICEENDPQRAAVPEDYQDVLGGKEEFICVTENGERFLVDGNHVRNASGEELYQILYFSIVDMEGDGADEVVLTCGGNNLILHAAEGAIYGYVFDYWNEMGAITKEGVFKTGYPDENKYGKILSFGREDYRMEQIENYEVFDHDRIRYYAFSEEAVNQW